MSEDGRTYLPLGERHELLLGWERRQGTPQPFNTVLAVRKRWLTSKMQLVLGLAVQQGIDTLRRRLRQEEKKTPSMTAKVESNYTSGKCLKPKSSPCGLLKPARLAAQFLNAFGWGSVTY